LAGALILLGLGEIWLLQNLGSLRLERLAWAWLGWGLIGAGLLWRLYPAWRAQMLLPLLSLSLTCGLIEGGTRLLYRLAPYERTATTQPHPVMGWTLVEDHEFPWMGPNPACISFRNQVRTNSLGYFDREHTPLATDGTRRLALFGDSFIAALELPYAARLGPVLEARLEQGGLAYEVLNFGVSGYSTGQMYYSYQQHGRAFAPDDVLALSSPFIAGRINVASVDGKVVIRPAFLLDESVGLVSYPASGYEQQWADYQASLGPDGFQPLTRTYLIPGQATDRQTWLTRPYFALEQQSQALLFLRPRLAAGWANFYQGVLGLGEQAVLGVDPHRLEIDLALMQQFGAEVTADGARFVILDDWPQADIGARYAALAAENGWGYIRLADPLAQAGQNLRFLCDEHYNAGAQVIMAEAIYDWLQSKPAPEG
jgi:hypothetical protein